MDPIAFQLGPLPVRWFGLLVAAGLLAGLWTATRRGIRDGLRPEQVSDTGPWLIIGVILGARIWYVVSYWENFAGQPWTEIFMVQRGGIVFYGGFVGGVVAMLAYCRIRKVPLWKLADALAPSIALGSVFGRIGCFMNGCCHGRACSLPWAVTYPPAPDAPQTPVHPVQIYDSLLNLGLYVFLAWLYRRKKFNGQVFAGFLICYAFTRSFVEYFRGDYTAGHIYGGFLTPAQLVSIGILAAGLILFTVLRRARTQPVAPRS